MEMEVDNPLNDEETSLLIEKTESVKETDDLFQQMSNLVGQHMEQDVSQDSVMQHATPDQGDNVEKNVGDIMLPNIIENKEDNSNDKGEEQEETNTQIQMDQLKAAEEEMNEVDVVVCGGCHSVYHFVEDLTRHKPNCTRKSNFRNIYIEDKPQVWAFLLWKNAQGKHVSRTGEVVEESSWKLYNKWCKMPERIRNAWVAAGEAVMTYTTFGNKQPSPSSPEPSIHNVYSKGSQRIYDEGNRNGEDMKPVVMKKLVQRDHLGEIKEIRSSCEPSHKTTNTFPKPTTLKDEIESIRNQLEGNDSDLSSMVGLGGTLREEEFVVEKIVSRRFNPKKKQYEYLLKWEGYPSEQNTWEPAENLETCQHLLKQFEDNLAKQNSNKPKSSSKKVNELLDLPGPSSAVSPLGRPVRHSKQKALNQVKQWCGSIKPDDPLDPLKRKFEFDSDEDDFLMKRDSDGDDSILTSQHKVFKSDVPTVKRKVGRPPKNRNLTNGTTSASEGPNLAAALGLESDSEDSPLAILNQRASATRVSNLSPLNQQVLVANAKGVVKVDPSQVPNLTSGVYIMSNKSIVKLDSVTPSKALALKGTPHTSSHSAQLETQAKPDQVLMLKNRTPIGQKSGIIRKTPGIIKPNPIGRPPRPLINSSVRVTTPGSKLQSGIVPRSSVAGMPVSGVRPRGGITHARPLIQRKIMEPEKKIFIGSKTVGRGGLKSGIHRKNAIGKGDTVESKLKPDSKQPSDTGDIFQDLPESESSESDMGLSDDFPKEMGPIQPASPPRPLTLCPLTGKVLSKAEGEKTPDPTPPSSPSKPVSIIEKEIKKEHGVKVPSTPVSLPSSSQTTSNQPKALFVNASQASSLTNTVVTSSVSSIGKPLIVNTSKPHTTSSQPVVMATQSGSTIKTLGEQDDEDMVTIAGEDGLVYKVSNSDLGNLLGEDGEQCVFVTEGDDGESVLALAQYPTSTSMTTLTTDTLTTQDQHLFIKQEENELVSLQQESEEPQVIAQLVEASEPAPGGQRRVVLLLPDGNLMMTEVDEEQYAALELDK